MRKRVLFEIRSPRKDVNEWIVGTVRYDIGGMNYFSGVRYERGYYFSVGPETRSGNSIEFAAFSAPTVLIRPVKSYTMKAMDETLPDCEVVERLLGQVWQACLSKSRQEVAA